jgi:uncharacterized YccA/Bax inhibitor family protein
MRGHMSFRSGNPALTANTFNEAMAKAGEERMTVMGTVHKTGLGLLILLLTASYSWGLAVTDPMLNVCLWGGLVGGFITAMIIIFKKHLAPVLTPVYAALEGLFLGAISCQFEMQYGGIVSQAVLCTFGVLAALLMAYQSGLIKPTENFKLGVVAATGGIAIFYIVALLMNMFGGSIDFMTDSSPLSIGISVFVVTIAALNLVLDFDFIEQGAEAGAPKYMEWFGAFGLMVTLIWLYLEILRLLAKLRDR